jgi:hypothetical protein
MPPDDGYLAARNTQFFCNELTALGIGLVVNRRAGKFYAESVILDTADLAARRTWNNRDG